MRRQSGLVIFVLACSTSIVSSGVITVAQDGKKADPSEILKKASAGDVASQNLAASMYLEGRGVKRSLPDALKWFKNAAEAGNADAQYNLALMYERGEGTEPNCPNAAKWYSKAVEQNHVYAIENLLALYDAASCLPHDDAQIASLTRQLADLGNPDAQLNIGSFYLMGKGVPKDEAEAAKWFALAAERGQPTAQFMLGQCYRDGTGGLAQNYVAAYEWFTLSVAAGNALDGRSFLNTKMTAEQVAEAKKQAEAWTLAHTLENHQQ